MKQEWVINVLEDLRTFAVANNLTALAAELLVARDLASIEIADQNAEKDKERKYYEPNIKTYYQPDRQCANTTRSQPRGS